jgi:ATP/maltotriose-dependent transcriptional regulator MalT
VFLLRLASALAAQDPPVTLVLDDLHLLTDPKVLDGLDYLLRNAGPGLRLVVSARMDPLLPLHRYRLAGRLTEIRAGDLAFTVAEAGELLARHGHTLTADSLKCLTRRTEGWAAGLRLAAISMGTHPDPDQFARELITDDSALTGYLVEEVLNTQPPEVRDFLLSTSILEQVSGEAARELTGNAQAAGILPALAHANAFVQPIGSGWFRYHTLFAEVLRLKLRREHPDRVAVLHRAAARWYERNGELTDAVRHAAQAGDWPLAASIVIDQSTIGKIIEPRGAPSLAGHFAGMPHGQAWTGPEPHLVSAAVALSAGRPESSTAVRAALAAAGRAGRDHSPEAAVALAHAWAAAGDAENATRAFTPVLAAGSAAPEPVRLQAWLVDAELGYHHGDRARGRGSLACALRLAGPEQLRLPFVIERDWIGPVLRRDPELARAHRCLLAPAPRDDPLPAPRGAPDQTPILAAEPLTEREQEVLRHLSGLLSPAEVASEMHISVNTVKTHVTHIYRKLATTRRGEAVRRARQLELI